MGGPEGSNMYTAKVRPCIQFPLISRNLPVLDEGSVQHARRRREGQDLKHLKSRRADIKIRFRNRIRG
jgi:hypothetical protein